MAALPGGCASAPHSGAATEEENGFELWQIAPHSGAATETGLHYRNNPYHMLGCSPIVTHV